ncbi:MAG: sulfatase-like hydrolase/transferase, partial [Pirellulaceae bacterium]
MRCFAVFLLPICFLPSTLAAASPRQPNIILVMADDLGWSDIGCYGGEIVTPHIDSMARDGLRFAQFYNNSICGPTRASLLTGLYCQQIGHAGERWNEPKDFTKCVTIGEVLQQVGYRTLMVGKWQGRDSPLDRGFDRFFGPMCQAKISYFNEVQRNPYFLDRKRLQLPVDFYLTDALNEHAVQFLEESVADKAPFFLYVAHIAPHWPLHARPGEVAKYRERYRTKGWDQARAVRFENQRDSGLLASSWKLSPRPPAIGDWANDPYKKWQAERMAVYSAQVAAIDRGVGQLLEALRHGDELDNTLIMFLSDNGAAPDGGL